MSIEATKERIRRAMKLLQDCGIKDAVLVFEGEAGGDIVPHIVKVGSPLACLAMSEWAATYQREEAYEGLEVAIWYDEDDDEVEG